MNSLNQELIRAELKLALRKHELELHHYPNDRIKRMAEIERLILDAQQEAALTKPEGEITSIRVLPDTELLICPTPVTAELMSEPGEGIHVGLDAAGKRIVIMTIADGDNQFSMHYDEQQALGLASALINKVHMLRKLENDPPTQLVSTTRMK